MTKAAASRQEAEGSPLASSYTVAISTKNTSLAQLNGKSLQLTATPNATGGASLTGSLGSDSVDGYLDSTEQIVFTLTIDNVAFSLTGTLNSNGTQIRNGRIYLPPPPSPEADVGKPINDVGEGTWTAQSGGGGDPDDKRAAHERRRPHRQAARD